MDLIPFIQCCFGSKVMDRGIPGTGECVCAHDAPLGVLSFFQSSACSPGPGLPPASPCASSPPLPTILFPTVALQSSSRSLTQKPRHRTVAGTCPQAVLAPRPSAREDQKLLPDMCPGGGYSGAVGGMKTGPSQPPPEPPPTSLCTPEPHTQPEHSWCCWSRSRSRSRSRAASVPCPIPSE